MGFLLYANAPNASVAYCSEHSVDDLPEDTIAILHEPYKPLRLIKKPKSIGTAASLEEAKMIAVAYIKRGLSNIVFIADENDIIHESVAKERNPVIDFLQYMSAMFFGFLILAAACALVAYFSTGFTAIALCFCIPVALAYVVQMLLGNTTAEAVVFSLIVLFVSFVLFLLMLAARDRARSIHKPDGQSMRRANEVECNTGQLGLISAHLSSFSYESYPLVPCSTCSVSHRPEYFRQAYLEGYIWSGMRCGWALLDRGLEMHPIGTVGLESDRPDEHPGLHGLGVFLLREED